MKNLIKFIKLPLKTKILLIEAYILLGFSRLIILSCPFKRIAGLLGEENRETEFSNEGIDIKKVYAVARGIKTMSKYTLWESKCLAQAYTAKFMLSRRGLKSTVYLGVSKNKNGKMIAHAWLRCGCIYVTGGNGGTSFTVTSKFAG